MGSKRLILCSQMFLFWFSFFFDFIFFPGSLFIPILVLFEKPLEFHPQHLHSLRIYNFFFIFLFIYLCAFSMLVFYLFFSGRYWNLSEIEWQEMATIKSEKKTTLVYKIIWQKAIFHIYSNIKYITWTLKVNYFT